MVTGKRITIALSVLSCMALIATACGTKPSKEAGETPVKGGTLKLLGSGDVDHLDPASAYYTVSYTLERAFTRQLVSYPTTTDLKKATDPVADMATELPTKSNGGISSDGKTYTFHIRKGVKWSTSPPRQVTAQDQVLGLKRLCNPGSPVGAPGYYTDTIVGMKEYCDAFAQVKGDAASIAAYINGHDIAGVKATDDSAVVITLTKPAGDFLNIMALPFTTPAPQEYLQYVPDDATFRTHTISNGPYQITKYEDKKSITLERNPGWDPSTDPIRKAYVDRIEITQGSNDATIQQQLQAGTTDMSWDEVVPTANLPALVAAKDPNLGVFPAYSNNPYLVMNLQSPNANGAMNNLKVRQALEYAIDKTALVRIYGGPDLSTPLNQIIPPGNSGYEELNLYPTPNNAGDPAKCKSLLAEAGYPNGLTLKYVSRNAGKHPDVAQSVQADLKKCGITANIIPVNRGDFYGKFLNSPDGSKRGVWDIAAPGWVPDWFGNNGRSFVAVLFDGRTYGPNSVNYGYYNNPVVNDLIDKALAESDVDAAAKLWHQADMQIMKDAAIVPFKTDKTAIYHASRVHNAVFLPFSQNYDITNVWVK